MPEQVIVRVKNDYTFLLEWLKGYEGTSIMLVCGKSFVNLNVSKYLQRYALELNIQIICFSDFLPNPDYTSVENGVVMFNENNCSALIAVGGGSAIDVAKCIKLYHTLDKGRCYLEQKIVPNSIDFLAVPTTAGTGSETTRYAVIYYNGEKQSIVHESCIPRYVLLDHTVLVTLNDYHKKASMLDALCHAIESFWSVHSTKESMQYSAEAIQLIYKNAEGYLANEPDKNEQMMWAAHLAGKAINITQTTAGHAMCYKLTSLYQIAHGFAAALCTTQLWLYMLNSTEKCIDPRGEQHLKRVFSQIAEASGERDAYKAARKFLDFVTKMVGDIDLGTYDIDCLIASVNPVRLKNNPVKLEKEDIKKIYKMIYLAVGKE